jgi:hypothetical protein
MSPLMPAPRNERLWQEKQNHRYAQPRPEENRLSIEQRALTSPRDDELLLFLQESGGRKGPQLLSELLLGRRRQSALNIHRRYEARGRNLMMHRGRAGGVQEELSNCRMLPIETTVEDVEGDLIPESPHTVAVQTPNEPGRDENEREEENYEDCRKKDHYKDSH